MSGALFRNVAANAVLLIRRNAVVEPFSKTGFALSDVKQLQSRPYFRSTQLLGRAKKTGFSPPRSSSFCSSSSSSSASAGFVGWYLRMIKSRPIVTKSITSSLIYIAADLSSQTIAKTSSDSYDLLRTARMGSYGLFALGPALHCWYNFLSKLFPKQGLITAGKKMALGLTIYGPTMTVIFFSMNSVLQGESGSDIVARLERDLLPALINAVIYWPVCDFITFMYVPVHLQPLVSNCFSYVWSIYMTYMASLDKPDLIQPESALSVVEK